LVVARAWHARHDAARLLLEDKLLPSWTAIVTDPFLGLTLHWPRVPARHELSMATPTCSAASSTLAPAGNGADRLEMVNATTGVAGEGSTIAAWTVACRSPLLPAGPKASVRDLLAGDAELQQHRRVASIMAAGPQRWTLRRAMSGTD
jgi:hypothetical protein